jgi:hypothetical protein
MRTDGIIQVVSCTLLTLEYGIVGDASSGSCRLHIPSESDIRHCMQSICQRTR